MTTAPSTNPWLKDEFGPEYVLRVYDAKIGLEGFLVVDNTALGPGKGGIRMTPEVSEEEVFRLARAMTWKNALANIPFGGAKAGIRWPGGDGKTKKALIESFARALKPFTPKRYIAAPDINTGEREMAWFVKARGNLKAATGKPANLCLKVFGGKEEHCGLPHEFGSTGFGVAWATKVAADFRGLDLRGASCAIAGFGNVGSFAFKYLAAMGVKVVAVSDAGGTIVNRQGLRLRELLRLKAKKKSVVLSRQGEHLDLDAIYELPVDILVPAAISDVIGEGNVDKVKAQIIVEGANIPMAERYEEELSKRGVLVVPDIVANAGGVISSYAEYRGYNPKRMFQTVKKKITANTRVVLEASKKKKLSPRRAALALAQEKILKQMASKKRTFP